MKIFYAFTKFRTTFDLSLKLSDELALVTIMRQIGEERARTIIILDIQVTSLEEMTFTGFVKWAEAFTTLPAFHLVQAEPRGDLETPSNRDILYDIRERSMEQNLIEVARLILIKDRLGWVRVLIDLRI